VGPSPIHGLNPWPQQVPGLATALQSYVKACQQLGSTLLRHIALGLGLPEQYFLGPRAGPDVSYWVLRVINYPPLPGAEPPAQPRSDKGSATPAAAGEGSPGMQPGQAWAAAQ
jgi:isopenicillin N synthase-like dioxygenase